MFELFKNCNNIIEIDLSNLDCSNLNDLDSTFENCYSLEIANLSLNNGKNINSMDYSFNKCKKLKDVDFSNFYPKQNISLNYLFQDCTDLSYVDLSNFYTFNYYNIFDGCTNINLNFQNLNNFYINKVNLNDIFRNILEKIEKKCEIGEGPKCKTCEEDILFFQYCEECNEKYFIPLNKKRKECAKCNENCLKCFGSLDYILCSNCEEGYFLKDGKCIQKCLLGENEKCKECDENSPNLCGSCNDGYFISSDNKSTCKKCNIDNCIKCNGDSNFNECILCNENYTLFEGKCLQNCEKGNGNKCKECNTNPEKVDQCLKCNEGFYLPEDEFFNRIICQKCSINGCKTCSGYFTNDKCLECIDGLGSLIKNNEIINCYDLPERIDIVINGALVDGIIEKKADHVEKIQLNNGIKYYISDTCYSLSSDEWWNEIKGNCSISIYYNFSNILLNNVASLEDHYILHLNGTERFTANGNSSYCEFMIYPSFFKICDNKEWTHIDRETYCSNTFGIYYDLERVNHNGMKFIDGIYTRGYDFYQLEGFNYQEILEKGTQQIGWKFGIKSGDFNSVRANVSITFIVNDLYLVRKK